METALVELGIVSVIPLVADSIQYGGSMTGSTPHSTSEYQSWPLGTFKHPLYLSELWNGAGVKGTHPQNVCMRCQVC